MIIGRGLMARSFSSYENNNEYLIFASGVSNSKEERDDEYQREIDLLCSREENMKLIYFSTINIDDDDRKYFQHKRKIESIIANRFDSYLIFRLPQIIGIGGNENNIFNFIYKSIKDHTLIKVQKDVYRSLIDVDDIKQICEYCFALSNTIINISSIESLMVIDIINLISKEIGITPNIEYIETTISKLNINSDIVEDAINSIGINRIGYIEKIIKKYDKCIRGK